jgi:hypothetical protein
LSRGERFLARSSFRGIVKPFRPPTLNAFQRPPWATCSPLPASVSRRDVPEFRLSERAEHNLIDIYD